MAREKKQRMIQRAPNFNGFKPFGRQNKSDKKTIELDFEEYEAIKLCDYDMLNHDNASKLMGISRPTFTRVYQAARVKVAKAMVEASAIIFKIGRAEFGVEWLRCNDCSLSFSVLTEKEKKCPFCESVWVI